jgi:hypothetical protein
MGENIPKSSMSMSTRPVVKNQINTGNTIDMKNNTTLDPTTLAKTILTNQEVQANLAAIGGTMASSYVLHKSATGDKSVRNWWNKNVNEGPTFNYNRNNDSERFGAVSSNNGEFPSGDFPGGTGGKGKKIGFIDKVKMAKIEHDRNNAKNKEPKDNKKSDNNNNPMGNVVNQLKAEVPIALGIANAVGFMAVTKGMPVTNSFVGPSLTPQNYDPNKEY